MDKVHVSSSHAFYSLGLMEVDGSQSRQQVIIDWTNAKHDRRENEKLVERMETFGHVLSSADDIKGFGFLKFMGFFYDNRKQRFGLISARPSSLTLHNQNNLTPVTLYGTWESRNHSSQWRPSLQGKFALAHALARSILRIHESGWYHKRISSSTIIFFPSTTQSTEFFVRPYIIGLSLAETMAVDDLYYTDDHTYYRHPQFLQTKARYSPAYDFYSLGIVLLEVGLWRPLQESARKLKGLPEELQNGLLKKFVPLLSHTMGDNYRHAVEICLRGEWKQSLSDEGVTGEGIQHMFRSEVVDVLAKINI